MNGPLIDVTKRILKRKYGVECTEPFAGVDRFRRTTGKSVAQIDLTSMNGGTVYKLKFVGFCYDNDEIRPTESANPKDLAELIDEFLTEIETNLAILVKMHRPYSKKKRILNFSEAKELLESVGFIVEHVNSHPLDPKYFVRYLKKLLNNYGFLERGKDAELKSMSYLYTYDTKVTRFEISEEGEYDDEIIVNILFSGISSDGSVYTIVADDISYNGDNIEDFKAALDQVFKVRE